jgi:hydrogenase maturation protease
MNDINQTKKTLLIGIGNYGRADDALGWKFIDEFSDWVDFYDFEYRYQLQIEDAELVSKYEKVIFVDASHQPIAQGFSFYPCVPAPTSAFTTHQLNPETVLWLSQELFNASPKGLVMAIEGNYWELHHGLSEQAEENFKKATVFFKDYSRKTIGAPYSLKAIL